MGRQVEIIILRSKDRSGERVFAALLVFLGLALFAAVLPTPLTEEEVLVRAFREGEVAAQECRARRLSGEISTFLQSAQCSNGRIIQAFRAVNYRYMDLITKYAEGRLQIAQKIGRGLITEAQAKSETMTLINDINEAARQRDIARR